MRFGQFRRRSVAGAKDSILLRGTILALLISLIANLTQRAENRRLRGRLEARQSIQRTNTQSPPTEVSRLGGGGDGAPAEQASKAAADAADAVPLVVSGSSNVSVAAAEEDRREAAVLPEAIEVPSDLGPVERRIFKRHSPDQIRALTNSIALFPNGVRVGPGAESDGAREVDPLAANLIHGFSLLDQGQQADAGAVFESILTACPQWPYGYFYLALATGNRAHMEQAEGLLLVLDALDRATPESRLYQALADLFLGNPETMKVWLAMQATGAQPLGEMMLGPLYVPKAVPAAIRRRLETIKGMPLLQTAGAVR